MTLDLPAALLTLALWIRQSEPAPQPAIAASTTSQTVDSPAPLPPVRPRKVIEPVGNERRARKVRLPDAPSARTEAKPAKQRVPAATTVMEEVQSPPLTVASPAPMVAAPPQELPVYGQERSVIRGAALPLLMLAAGAALLAHVLRKEAQ